MNPSNPHGLSRKFDAIALSAWNEGDHPRKSDGKFSEKGSAKKSSKDYAADIARAKTDLAALADSNRRIEEARAKALSSLPVAHMEKLRDSCQVISEATEKALAEKRKADRREAVGDGIDAALDTLFWTQAVRAAVNTVVNILTLFGR